LEILKQHDQDKSRKKKHHYLLRNLAWIRHQGKEYKFFGSTPSGRNQSYSYYITRAKLDGKCVRISCSRVDDQIPILLGKLVVDPKLLSHVRDIYQEEIVQITEDDRDINLADLKRRVTILKDEETKIARLLILGKISEDAYDQLRIEWQEKLSLAKKTLMDMERETNRRVDDLDLAVLLMSQISVLYERLGKNERSMLLRILAKRIILNSQGEIIDYELRSPFAYLHNIANQFCEEKVASGSAQVQPGPLCHKN
jgi:hypothetical protein